MRAFAALLALALLAGCTTPEPEEPTALAPEPEAPVVEPKPVAIHESFDLTQGFEAGYAWELHAGFKEARARVVLDGPGGIHGFSGLCMAYVLEETYPDGTGRRSVDECSTGYSFSNQNLEAEVVFEHVTAPETLHGDYTLSLSSAPQVGTAIVEIVVTY